MSAPITLQSREWRLNQFQSLKAELTAGANPAQVLTRLFNGFSAEFTKAEALIKGFNDQVRAFQAAHTERPTTAETTTSIQLTRTGIETIRATIAMREELGTNAPKIALITRAHARELLMARRSEVTPLGCWLTNNADSHNNGYKALNLGSTKSRVEGHTHTSIGIAKFYLHHLALIAFDRADELGWVSAGDKLFQISHLCHNPGCFNGAHLLVEESDRNKDRNTCQGHEILEYSGVGPLRYNPCRHGGPRGELHKCILPTRHIQQPGNYGNEN